MVITPHFIMKTFFTHTFWRLFLVRSFWKRVDYLSVMIFWFILIKYSFKISLGNITHLETSLKTTFEVTSELATFSSSGRQLQGRRGLLQLWWHRRDSNPRPYWFQSYCCHLEGWLKNEVLLTAVKFKFHFRFW